MPRSGPAGGRQAFVAVRAPVTRSPGRATVTGPPGAHGRRPRAIDTVSTRGPMPRPQPPGPASPPIINPAALDNRPDPAKEPVAKE
jgi:hypothetical protein